MNADKDLNAVLTALSSLVKTIKKGLTPSCGSSLRSGARVNNLNIQK